MKKTLLSGEQVGSAETQSNKNYSVKAVEGKPFGIVETNEGHVIIFGKNAITDRRFKSYDEAVKWINGLDWNAILNVVGIYVEHVINKNNGN